MAYYLAVERKVDSYEAINIRNTRKGRAILPQPNNSKYECTLEEIDKFTTQYDSLQSLKYDLYNENKISWFTCPLAIVYSDGLELRITKDILLSSSIEYLKNPDLVIEYLVNKFCSFDIHFTKELAQVLPEKSIIRTKVENMVLVMEAGITHDIPLDVTSVVNLAQSLVYNLDKNGFIKESKTIDYEMLHNIIVFITNYENKEKEKTKNRIKTKNT